MVSKYGVVMICRNEADRIDACLESARRYADVATIIDTGSTDDTVKRCLKWFPGSVKRRKWVNFGHNRSQAFALARGTADWLLALDADMTIEIDEGFDPDADPQVQAYMIRMGGDDFSWRLPLVLKGDLPWQSLGAVHEYTSLGGGAPHYYGLVTDAIRVQYEHRSSREKTQHYAELLEADLAANPENSRTIFYLAQSYRELGRSDEARALYYQRAEMGGYVEEEWYSLYMAALLEPQWEVRLAALLKAWEKRPDRLEPLSNALRELNSRSLHHTSYLLALSMSEKPANGLFVQAPTWNWVMDFERSIAAYWVGNKDECRILCDRLLARGDLPANVRERVIANRAFCPEPEGA